MNTPNICQSCRVTKAQISCTFCETELCKNCAQRLIAIEVPFSELMAKELQEGVFCYGCFDEKVSPAIEAHKEVVAKAREVRVIMKAFRGQVSIVKKARAPIKVEHCEDRQEALMKLAYATVMEGFNGIVRTEIFGKKVRENEYQKTWWSAQGTPALVREAFSEDKYVAFDN